MKQTLKNIISLIMLVFYLAGYCGVSLQEQACHTCDRSEISILVDSDSEPNKCSCIDKTNLKYDDSHTHDTLEEDSCCYYDHLYFKTNPSTTLTEYNKAPAVDEISLIFCHIFNSEVLLPWKPIDCVVSDYYQFLHRETNLEKLCTFLC